MNFHNINEVRYIQEKFDIIKKMPYFASKENNTFDLK